MDFSKVKELKAQMDDLREKANEETKKLFLEGAKELFNKHSSINSISWRQYTMYFNDGDEVCFSSHAEWCDINDDEEGYSFKKEHPNAWEDVRKFLGLFDDDDYENLFGDHAKVTLSMKDGKLEAEVEEYTDHD